MTATMYEQDFYAWASQQAALLRAGRVSEADIEHIAEELESMGASERRELINRLAVLLAHLLKWQHQPERRSNSWKATIEVQRFDVAMVLKQNPSLKHKLDEYQADAYHKAVLLAVKDTGRDRKTFAVECPFTLEQALDNEFWPE